MMKPFAQHSYRTLVLLSWLTAACSAQQPTVSSYRVFTEPSGAFFEVDGVLHSGPATFLWPTNSKHELKMVPVQDSTSPRVRYNFVQWTD